MSQDTFESKRWGTLHFFEVKEINYNACCKRCLLNGSGDECRSAPCVPWCREDGKNGYFSIHQMPKQ